MRKNLYTTIALFALSVGISSPVNAQQSSNVFSNYQETSVHDPSVVFDNAGTYYIFGSHLAVSKTTDLMNWTSGVGGYETDDCTLFANPAGTHVGYANAYDSHVVKKVKNYQGQEVAFGNFNVHDWQKKGNNVQGMQWAPDVIWNPTMNKWLMYMSVNGDDWCSAIVCLAADNIEGPYVYQGPVVFSGFKGTADHNGYGKVDDWKRTDLAIATGATSLPERYNVGSSWGSFWPNCIDPCVRYDNGKLYMTYGSWSGGIFQLELDENTGLRDYTVQYPYEINNQSTTATAANQNCTSDPYFGKKIAGGWYVSGEGPYIQKIGKYYYLFLSYGGLESTGGYEMRVFRSEKIDGPYDYALYDGYRLNFGPNAKTNRGQRILGAMGSWGADGEGELAQGHNSVLVDNDGDAFVVYHTRFVDGGEGHQVRVRQLFVNAHGNLVASPFRYTGKQTTQKDIDGGRLFSAAEIAGTYKLMLHPYRLDHKNKEVSLAKTVTLTSDGKVYGEGLEDGVWEYTDAGKSYIHLEIDLEDYYGVVIRQNVDHMNDTPAICFSAVKDSYSAGGEAVWLYKLENSTQSETIYPESRVKNTSSDWWTNFSKDSYVLFAGESLNFKFYNYSNKAENFKNWCLYGATAPVGGMGYKEYFGVRNDNWNNAEPGNTGCVSDYNWDTFKEDMDGSLVDMTVNYSTSGEFTMLSVITTTTGKKYNYSFTKTIEGTPCSLSLFFVNEGSYIDGSTLTGIENVTSSGNSKVHNASMFNLNGQRVGKDYKGIVVQNGKKYIKK